MQNFAEKDLFFTIFSLFLKKKVFFLRCARFACKKKRAFCARVGPKTRAADNTKNKWHQDFLDMEFFFLAQGSFLARHEKLGSLP